MCICSFGASTFLPPENLTLPNAVDWRQHGFVTPVKSQGTCGSCWAFSTTGSLEGQHFRKTGQLISLSEQNLVDCAPDTHGCVYGFVEDAFKYILINGGIDNEISYPYEAVQNQCRFRRDTIGATSTGFVKLKTGDEMQLTQAVASIGPISVLINSSLNSFRFYHTGVYNDPSCDPNKLTHAVLVVGYGTDKSGGDFWLVKNSWSTDWGDHGYVKMKRNANQCGIANNALYPLV